MKKRILIWIAVFFVFLLLLALVDFLINLELFSNALLMILIIGAFWMLFGLNLLTSHLSVWKIKPQKAFYMGLGAALYVLLSYLFNDLINLSFGPLVLRPALCIPIIFGFTFGPAVGFFVGAVGSLLGDYIIGWDILPIWNIASGVMGTIPGFAIRFKVEKHFLCYLTTAVVLLITLTVCLVFIHPQVPKPWTDEIQDFSQWGWLLLVELFLLLAHGYLLQQISSHLSVINLWGALGILISTLFASLTNILLYGFTLGTALIGNFAPSIAADLITLMLFTPVIFALYLTFHKNHQSKNEYV